MLNVYTHVEDSRYEIRVSTDNYAQYHFLQNTLKLIFEGKLSTSIENTLKELIDNESSFTELVDNLSGGETQ